MKFSSHEFEKFLSAVYRFVLIIRMSFDYRGFSSPYTTEVVDLARHCCLGSTNVYFVYEMKINRFTYICRLF